MYRDFNIDPYILHGNATIKDALVKLAKSKTRILFIVDSSLKVIGAFTDGDFRRWAIKNDKITLQHPVHEIINLAFIACLETDSRTKISALLSDKITSLPLLDEQGTITAVATKEKPLFTLNGHTINAESSAFVIAEIGNNHNGSLDLAKQLILSACQSGADCAKFQMRDLTTLYKNQGDSDDASEDLGSQYVLDLLSRFQLKDEEFKSAFEYCRSMNLAVLCTPFDIISANKLHDMGVEAFKIASADLTNHELISHIARFNKPMILSTGMATEQEIIDAVHLLDELSVNYILLHCNSTYPAPYKDINLNYMERLSELSDNVVGYSGHERGIHIPISAVAMGARIIEKHFTHDKTMEGNDHKVSLLPDEFSQMVEAIRDLELALGTSAPRSLSQGEIMNRETLAKSLIVNQSVKKGQYISRKMIDIKSPGKGIQPSRINDIIGKMAPRDMRPGDFFYPSDIDSNLKIQPRSYRFNQPFGIPVRFHDMASLVTASNFDFIEFHLSYKDMALDVSDYLEGQYSLGFVVHAPELFSGDHTLDLCSLDETYRKRSIAEMQKVINITRGLKEYFPNTETPCIVCNVGGFSTNGFLTDSDKQKRYTMLEKSLMELDTDGVEIIPQTMPPFPWHFGGQQYHNLFVSADDIIRFCQRNAMRICFDLSHTALACNYYNWDLYEFTHTVSELIAHNHIADAQGDDGEGLQIGHGDIDFTRIFSILYTKCPHATWLPEIWQGHKNNGEGFWRALDSLEHLINQ